MGHRQRAQLLGRKFDRAADRAGVSPEEMASRMNLVARIVDYGNVLVCTDCGHVGLHVEQVYSDHTEYRCGQCGRVRSATPREIAKGAPTS